MRIALRGQRRESCQKFRAAVSIDSLPSGQPSERAHDFDVNQMWNKERFVTAGQFIGDSAGHGAVREEFDNHESVQNDHRSSRSWRITRAAVILAGIGFARW